MSEPMHAVRILHFSFPINIILFVRINDILSIMLNRFEDPLAMHTALAAAFVALAVGTWEMTAGAHIIQAITNIRTIRQIPSLVIEDIFLGRTLSIAFPC